MITKPNSVSGFLLSRRALACGLFLAAGFLTFLSFAATPPGGTLTDTSGPLTYTTGPNVVSNPSGAQGSPNCTTLPCDHYALTVNVPAAYANTHNMVITTSWTIAGEDYDTYLLQGAASETVLKSAATSADPEVMVTDAVSGSYRVRIIPFAVAGSTTTTTIELVEKPTSPPPPPPGAGTPRFHNFPGVGPGDTNAGEPTLGAGVPSPGQPGGPTMFIASLRTLRVTWDDCASPAGNLWENKSFATTSVVTLDPILFTDMGAGRNSPSRTFVSQLGPKTSFLAFSDDNGESYLQSQGSGINSGVDHQTIGGGPYNNAAIPPPPPHPTYPNAVYYASQDAAVAQLGRSDTGGATFGAAVPMYNLTQCGGLHGHVKVAPDGTVYIPNKNCAGKQAVVVSQDNGLTFFIRPVPDSAAGGTDPSLGIDANGKIYLAYADGTGRAKVAVSADRGVTWAPSIDVGDSFGIRNTVFPGAVGGSNGRATVQYLATTTSGNYQAIGTFTGVWHIYSASTFDGGASWTTTQVTPANDPVQRGSICTGGTTCGADRNLLDFNDIEIDHQGRIIIAYADGCIGCTSPTGADSRNRKATIARQSGGRRMLATFDPVLIPSSPASPRVTSVGKTGSVVNVAWMEPDHGGSSITGYNVYRRLSTGSYGAPLASLAANRTTYADPTTDPSLAYLYKVTAINTVGESINCGEFPIGTVVVPETPCVLPGITLQTDPAGDNTDAIPQHDLRQLSVAELYDPASSTNKLYVTVKVTDLNPVPPPSSRWTVFFTRGTQEWFVAMVTDDTANPGTPVYRYGHTSLGAGGVRQLTTDGLADSGVTTVDGTILITISNPTPVGTGLVFPPLVTGETLTNVNAIVQDSAGVLLLTVDSTGMSNYTLQGNAVCKPNTAPLAALSASPLTGSAPLTVTFDASGSSDADGDTIATYTFNFGDGSASVVQSSPTIQYVYRDNGNYNATVQVKDSRNAVSSNTADAVIQVATTLQSIASRLTHGTAGTYDIDLPTSGPVGVECRNNGSSFALVYTFQRNLTAVTTSTVSEGTAVKGTEGVGPAPNQYTVNLTGVNNGQYVSVTLDGVQDTAGTNLTAVRGRMAVLNGDITANLAINSSDVSAAKAVSGTATTSTNFRADVNANGVINSSDIGQVKANSGVTISAGGNPESTAPAAKKELR